jgi:YaiO family outer membrane protein
MSEEKAKAEFPKLCGQLARHRANLLLLVVMLALPRPVPAQAPASGPLNQPATMEVVQGANALFAQGDYEGALKAYLKVLPSFPDNLEILKNVAYCYFVRGARGYASAADYYQRAFRIKPDSWEVGEKLAICLRALKRPAEAADILRQIAELPRSPVETWKSAGEAYSEAGDAAHAESAFNTYLERRPGDLGARTELAEVYAKEKDSQRALEQYRMVLVSSPNYPRALVGMARILSQQSEYPKSLEIYDRVLQANPSNGEAVSGKAFVLLWMGRPAEAEPLFQEMHRRYPSDKDVARGLEEAQAALKKTALAEARRTGTAAELEADYRNRLEKNPKDLEALKAMVGYTSTPQQCGENADYARRALELSPGDLSLELSLARAQAACKQYPEAAANFRRYLQARPDAQDVRFELAQALVRSGKNSEAAETFRTILQQNPANLDARLGLAQMLAASGNYPEALLRYDEVLKQSPESYAALQGKAFVLYWTKKYDEAQAIFQKLAAERPSDPQNPKALQDIASAKEAAHWAALRPPPGSAPEKFVAFYRERLASYPNDLDALKGLAYNEALENDIPAALRDYQHVLELYPNDEDSKKEIARLNGIVESRSLQKARDLAYSGKAHRAEALALLKEHLQRVPDDTAARVLYGTVLSWEGQYDEARKQLEMVLAKNPTHGDALPALINVEIWSDHPARAEQLASEGLKAHPGNITYLLDEAHALRNLGRDREAAKVYKQALAVEPNNLDLQQSVWSFKKYAGEYTEFKIDHTYEFFNQIFGGQHETTVSMRTPTRAGSVTLREDRADRFGESSYQTEADFWPGFRPGTYGYLNLGYSNDALLYPRWRVGAELFQDTHGYEFSGGYRYMHFSSDVNIYTFSLGRYYGNWFFSGRTFLTPGDVGLSNTEVFTARRYFGNEGLHDYAEAFFSYGASPAQARTTLNILVLDSYRGGVTVDKTLGHFSVSLKAAMGREQRTYTNNLRRYTLEAQIYYRF